MRDLEFLEKMYLFHIEYCIKNDSSTEIFTRVAECDDNAHGKEITTTRKISGSDQQRKASKDKLRDNRRKLYVHGQQ